jgi:tetratricopeptide (TPR) repeat protein
MLYELLSHGNIASAVETFRQLIDELTPLLKDIVEHQMAGQQSKIVDALMRAGGTAKPADLARSTRLSLNTVTTQLRRLKDAQVVELRGGGKGRAAYYTVADQLFATWYQMRYLRPHRRKIEMFIEVLRIWFKAEERLEALRSLAAGAKESVGTGARDVAVTAEYFAAALAGTDYASVGEHLAVKSWLEIGEIREAAFALAELRPAQTVGWLMGEVGAYVTLGRWLREHDDLEKAVSALKAAVEEDPRDLELRVEYAGTLDLSGDHQGAIQIFDEVLSRAEDIALRAIALSGRGRCRAFLGDFVAAIADWTAVTELAGAPADAVAWALLSRGRQRHRQGDLAAAIADWTRTVEMDGASPGYRALALVGRGISRFMPHSDLAFADLLAAAQETGAATEVRLLGVSTGLTLLWQDKDRVEALLSALRDILGRVGAKDRFRQIIDLLTSLASPEMRSAWPTVWRAIAASEPAEVIEQIRFFDAVAEALEREGDHSSLDPLPPEQRDFALEVLRKFDRPARPRDCG